MDESVERLTAEYLWKIGNQVSAICPAASRYFVFSMERRLLKDDQVANFGAKRQKMFCNHCGSIWQPRNHRVRIKPCPVSSKNIRKLLRCKRDQLWNLTKQQKKKILTFEKSTNKIVYQCFSCKKRTVFQGNKKAKVPESVQNISAMTLPSLIFKTPKNKKHDINAGLFIPNSAQQMSPSCLDASISSLCQSVEKNFTEEAKFSTPFITKTATTPQSLTFKTPSSCSSVDLVKSSSIKKSKHSHLCRALQKETKKVNPKGNLSLFLSSL